MQDGAVVGRVFWLGALGSERWRLEETLHSLERKEFVRRERSSSVGGEAEYTFSHALVRDVAYEQIPRSLRAAKHRAAAEWIESLGRLEDHAEMLAHHYVQALDYADAAGEPAEQVAEQAARAFREAGNRAFSLNAYPAASRYYERALAISPNADLLLSLAEAQARAGDMPAAKETYLEAADAARRAGSVDQLARAALGYGGRFVWARAWGDERLVPLLEEALDALPREDSDLRVRLLARLAAGPLRDTLPPEPRMAMCREAVEIARRLDNPATLAYALDGLYCSNWSPDVLRERMQIAGELIEVAAALGDAEREYAGTRPSLPRADRARGPSRGAARARAPRPRWPRSLASRPSCGIGRRSRACSLSSRAGWPRRRPPLLEALELGRSAQTANAKVAFDLQMYALRREQGRLAEVVDSVKRAVDDYPAYPIWRYVLADVLAGLGRRHEAGRGPGRARGRRLRGPGRDAVAREPQPAARRVPVSRGRRAGRAASRGTAPLRATQRHDAARAVPGLGVTRSGDSRRDDVRLGRRGAALRGCARDEHPDGLRGSGSRTRPTTTRTCGCVAIVPAIASGRASSPPLLGHSRTSSDWRCCRRRSSSCSGARHRFARGVRRRRRRAGRSPAPARPPRPGGPLPRSRPARDPRGRAPHRGPGRGAADRPAALPLRAVPGARLRGPGGGLRAGHGARAGGGGVALWTCITSPRRATARSSATPRCVPSPRTTA